MNLYSVFSIFIYSNELYKQSIYGWDQTSAYTGTTSSRYQSISDLTQHMNEWNEAGPQHRKLQTLPINNINVQYVFTWPSLMNPQIKINSNVVGGRRMEPCTLLKLTLPWIKCCRWNKSTNKHPSSLEVVVAQCLACLTSIKVLGLIPTWNSEIFAVHCSFTHIAKQPSLHTISLMSAFNIAPPILHLKFTR